MADARVATVQDYNEIVELFGRVAHIMRDTLSLPTVDEYAIDASSCSGRTVALQDLLDNHRALCNATVEFERNATTLRTNSTALNLCRKLVSEDVPAAIAAYKVIPHRDLPAPPAKDSYIKFEHLLAVVKRRCTKLLAELDGIDIVASAKLYHSYTTFPGTRALPEYKALKNSHGHEGVGTCCAYLRYVSKELVSPGVKGGLDALMKKQEYFRNSFMDFATIATFFSSITATTLQFSYTNTDTTGAWSGVNICWFTSLVLSIASAANSFLGAVVYQSPEFLSGSDVHGGLFLHTWFAMVPPILLTISGVLFSIGICIFTFSHLPTDTGSIPGPSQGKAVQIITNSLTGLNFLALFAVYMLAFTKLHRLITPVLVVGTLIILAFLPALVIAPILWFIGNKKPALADCLFWNLGSTYESLNGEGTQARSSRIKKSFRNVFNDHWEDLQNFFKHSNVVRPSEAEVVPEIKTESAGPGSDRGQNRIYANA